MIILISGIHGFIGRNFVVALTEQNTIYGLDIVSLQKKEIAKAFNWNELEKIPPVDVIIHLAGKAHDTKNTTDTKSYFNINTGLTQKIFDLFLASSASKFIFFSSVKAVADNVTTPELTENTSCSPITPYGKSKLAAEQYILSKPLNSEKKVYILRPCMIHGPGNKGNLNLLFKIQQKGLPWPLGAFENKRSFCSIDNLLFTVQQIINQSIEPGIYQVADDDALSTNELIRLMAVSQNKKARIWNIPAGLIKTFAHLGDLVHFPLNSERLKKLTESYVVSNSKIKQALKIDKMPVTAVAGLQKTLESFTNKD
jgi:nucleoside-diphosphate-sugar epimerase